MKATALAALWPALVFIGGVMAIWHIAHWVSDRTRVRRVPGLPCDGKPLSTVEDERFGWIEDGYGQTAREPGEAAVNRTLAWLRSLARRRKHPAAGEWECTQQAMRELYDELDPPAARLRPLHREKPSARKKPVNPAVSETAMIGLVLGNVMWPSILGALFLSGRWRVSTASKPKQVPQERAAPVTAEMPAIFTDRKAS